MLNIGPAFVFYIQYYLCTQQTDIIHFFQDFFLTDSDNWILTLMSGRLTFNVVNNGDNVLSEQL